MYSARFCRCVSLFSYVHHLQSHTTQTPTGPLMGAVFWFLWWGNCTQTKYSLVHSLHPNIHHRVDMDCPPSVSEIVCVGKICSDSNRPSSHCIPKEDDVHVWYYMKTDTEANTYIKGNWKDVTLLQWKNLVPLWELILVDLELCFSETGT